MATSSSIGLFRNAFQVGDEVLGGRTRYFSTVDFATSIPSLRSSPTMRGELHRGLALESLRIRVLTSLLTVGRPGLPPRLSFAQYARKRRCCQAMTVRRLHENQYFLPAGPQPREPGPQEPIPRLDARAFGCALINGKLMAQRHDLQLQGHV